MFTDFLRSRSCGKGTMSLKKNYQIARNIYFPEHTKTKLTCVYVRIPLVLTEVNNAKYYM